MTYPEDVLKAAEGVTHWWLSTEGATYQDLTAKVAEKLMAERQRCAEALPDEIELWRVVMRAKARRRMDIVRATLSAIKEAILGQQEVQP